MTALQFINANGTCYWGTFAKVGYLRHYGVLMRREPMVENRWYGNKHYVMKYQQIDGQYGERLIVLTMKHENGEISTAFNKFSFKYSILTLRGFFFLHHIESRDTYNCFRNRLMEYPYIPCVPLEKNKTEFQAWSCRLKENLQ